MICFGLLIYIDWPPKMYGGIEMLTKTMSEMKEIDRIAIDERGVDSLWLMENAAAAAADLTAQKIAVGSTITVLCGSGNNGGDGIAAARLLMRWGFTVHCILCGKRERMTADSLANEKRLNEIGGTLINAADTDIPGLLCASACVIDALFGVGLKRPLEGRFAEIVSQVNRCGAYVIACDLPSGLNGDTGEVMGAAIKANDTVTFSCAKPGLMAAGAEEYVGQLHIADIGIPKELLSGT